MKKIRVGKTHALVDDEDYDRINEWSWSLDGRGYAKRSIGTSTIGMHREVLGLSQGDPAVDHINRNRLDNQKSNLRLATPRTNALNQRRRGLSSRFYGVTWHKQGKWQAQADKKYLGVFDDELDAAQAVIDHLRTVT